MLFFIFHFICPYHKTFLMNENIWWTPNATPKNQYAAGQKCAGNKQILGVHHQNKIICQPAVKSSTPVYINVALFHTLIQYMTRYKLSVNRLSIKKKKTQSHFISKINIQTERPH
jgi:hypothetical protein